MRTIITMLLISCLCFLSIGCDKQKSLEKAERTSKKLATYADSGVNITRELYEQNIITQNQTITIADNFIKLADAGIAFDAKVADLKAYYAANGEKPDGKTLDNLAILFRSNIVVQFIEVLEQLKLVQPNEKLKLLISTIRNAVLIIASALDVENQTKTQIAGV